MNTPPDPPPALSGEQIEFFLEKGHVMVRGAVATDVIEAWVALAFKRLGYDRNDPATWREPIVRMPQMNKRLVREIAPLAHRAICQLMGGEDRLLNPEFAWGDGFAANFSNGADRPWRPPSARATGWHKDGDFFRHFLDSPEQGLLCIVVYSDILPRSGGTFVACDSVKPVARRLYEHPEGLLPGGFGGLIERCTDFTEITGKAGDVCLLHPFVLHAVSQNPSRRARFITNPCIKLNAPMEFNRLNPAEFSPVERAVLRALGRERIDFKIAAPREAIVPDRITLQEKLLEEQKARLELR